MANIIRRVYMSWFAMLLAVGWLWIFSQGDISAKIHGIAFPVVSNLVVESITPIALEGQPAVKLSGSATKFRECDFNGITWSIDGVKTSGTVRAFFRDAPQGRSEGVQHWSAIIVGVTVDRLSLTSSVVHHTCNGFPVNSTFFKGDV